MHTRVRDRVRDIRSVGAVVLFCVLAGKCEAVSEIIHFPLVLQASAREARSKALNSRLASNDPLSTYSSCVQRGPLLSTADHVVNRRREADRADTIGMAPPQHWAERDSKLADDAPHHSTRPAAQSLPPEPADWEWEHTIIKPSGTAAAPSHSEGTVKHRGSCHCGDIEFEVMAPSKLVIWECNCSNCRMRRNVHFVVPKTDLKVLDEAMWDRLAEYRYGTGTARHLFCARCGISPFYVPRSNPDGWGVSFQCIREADLVGRGQALRRAQLGGTHLRGRCRDQEHSKAASSSAEPAASRVPARHVPSLRLRAAPVRGHPHVPTSRGDDPGDGLGLVRQKGPARPPRR